MTSPDGAELDYATATELRRRIVSKDVSPVELTQRALAKAEATQKTLNAFFVLLPERALSTAKAAEDAIMRGLPLGPLHGIPFSAKDLMAVAGVPYASGSRAMAKNVGMVDAPAVERAQAAGAILIGKTTTSEFGCKPVGDSPLTGITPGGSSAGAAASVAAGITPFALGTDGGGSIRIPCCFTGLAGIKAHFGRVPVWPVSATPTLAHVGPIARNVADAALLLTAIGGYDPRDPFSVSQAMPNLVEACRAGVSGLRIAFSLTLGYARPNPEVAELVTAAARTFEQL